MKKKTSLKDIAEKLGVSTALVSYVLNNKKENRIRKEVAEKIRLVAQKMNYRPNQIAKSLKTNKTNAIGLIVADISNPFSSTLARIIEDEADKHGYTVISGSSDEKALRSQKLIDTFLNRQVDGLIIFPPADSQEQVKQLKKQQIPMVLVDRYFPGIDVNHVALDNFTAAYIAINHLVTTGRKRIGMITYKTTLKHLQERGRGYHSAIKNARIPRSVKLFKQVSIKNDKGEIESAVAALVGKPNMVDAIFFATNRIATIALKYIDSMKIRVPAKLALVAFDETEVFDFFHPPISYIKQPLEEIGQTATRLLISSMQEINQKQQIHLPADLIVRGSS